MSHAGENHSDTVFVRSIDRLLVSDRSSRLYDSCNTCLVSSFYTIGEREKGIRCHHTSMRISDRPIYSDLIAKGRADIILSVEPMEALRYLPYLREGGFVVTNSTPFINIVMLGAASPFIEIPFEYLEEGIRAIFSRKGAEIVEMNLKALRAGREFAQNYK